MGASDFARLPNIGASIKRKEDHRSLTGRGRYTDDIVLVNQSHAMFVRSPHAHAKIIRMNTSAAKKPPGVIDIFVGEDVAADKINSLPCGWLITSTDDTPIKEPPHPILAQRKVRFVGDHVAMVIAETLQQVKNAAELVEVDYEVLSAVVRVTDAAKAEALHDATPDNHCYKWAIGEGVGRWRLCQRRAYRRQHGCVSIHLLDGDSDDSLCIASGRPVRHAADLCSVGQEKLAR